MLLYVCRATSMCGQHVFYACVCVVCMRVCVCVCVCVCARACACVWLSTIRPQYVFNILPFSCNGNDVIPLGRSPPLSYPISGPKSCCCRKDCEYPYSHHVQRALSVRVLRRARQIPQVRPRGVVKSLDSLRSCAVPVWHHRSMVVHTRAPATAPHT